MLSWKEGGGGRGVKSYSTSAFQKETTTTTTEEDYFSVERSHSKRSTYSRLPLLVCSRLVFFL